MSLPFPVPLPTKIRSTSAQCSRYSTLGNTKNLFLYVKDKLGAMTQTPTFIDIVCKLRDVAAEMMLQTINIQRDNLISILTASGMTSTGSDRRYHYSIILSFVYH